jgi:hypothetical protein
MRRLVTGLRFEQHGVVVEFDEVFKNGLVRQQTLMVPHGADYMDEIMAVQESIDALIEDVLEDTVLMQPLTVEELRDLAEEDEPDLDEGGISMNGGS